MTRPSPFTLFALTLYAACSLYAAWLVLETC